MTLEEEVRLGAEARALIENELLQRVLGALKAQCFTAWTVATKTEEREDCWRLYNSAERFKTELEAMIVNGKFAGEAIEAQAREDAINRGEPVEEQEE